MASLLHLLERGTRGEWRPVISPVVPLPRYISSGATLCGVPPATPRGSSQVLPEHHRQPGSTVAPLVSEWGMQRSHACPCPGETKIGEQPGLHPTRGAAVQSVAAASRA